MDKHQANRIPEIDEILRIVDKWCTDNDLPILSVLVEQDGKKGVPVAVFWESEERYNLRRMGETDEALVARIRSECFSTTYPPGVPFNFHLSSMH